jgi:hypothetical protein
VKRNLARLSRWPLRSLSIGKLYEASKDEKSIHARALRLLRSWLSPQQRADFDRKGYFDVVGCDTGKRYRIRRGTSANVNEIDEYGRLGTGRCFVPLGGLAQGDVMLAQKIALETDENRALSIANSFPGPLGWRLPRRRPADARSSGVRLSPSENSSHGVAHAATLQRPLDCTTTSMADDCWIICPVPPMAPIALLIRIAALTDWLLKSAIREKSSSSAA